MEIGGLFFSKSVLEAIASWVEAEPSLSRRQLSRRLCAENGWRSANGQLKEMSCRKALAELERRNVIRLPTVERKFAFEATRASAAITVAPLSCSLAELGAVVVRPVSGRHEAQRWRSLLDSYHYLGSGPLCGAQLRYVVESPGHGLLGALAFTSAAFALQARDQYIGWSEAARRANLAQVVCNARLVIAAPVRVPNLASHVLALALARLGTDWEARYGVRPLLVETFVDPSRFAGSCYQAANWEEVGYTAGRRDGVAKRIYVRALCRDWRERLCQAPVVPLGSRPRPEAPAHWAEAEFGTVRWFDERLKHRLYRLAQDFYARSTATIPEACGSKAATLAAYRFFRNKAVSMEVLLTPHLEATIARLQEHAVVLAPQDTTTLDYNTHFCTDGLGPTNGAGAGGLGLLLHDTLAFTVDGTPLGVLDAQCWARPRTPPPARGREEKESLKWLRSFRKLAEIQRLCPHTLLVSIGDREADIWTLWREASQAKAGPHLLVRANRARYRQVDDQQLWDYLATRPVAAQFQLHIPRSGTRKARDAWVTLRHAAVAIAPPQRSTEAPIQLWAVHLQEETPAADVTEPVDWMLLTTVPVANEEDAKTRVQWYASRWGIEVYHRTLKSGCRIRDRQLGTADRLQACLGIDMVVAWRIYHLTMLGRETPDVPCTAFFNDIEWQTLCCFATQQPVPPEQPPTLSAAIRMVGKLGGHLGRRRDGPPGTQVLWRGLQRLDTAVETVALFGCIPAARPQARSP